MALPNPTSAIRAMLLADAGVAAIVGTDIFGGELPKEETASMPKQAVVIRPAPGISPQLGCLNIGSVTYDIRNYGASPLECSVLRLAVYDAMKNTLRVVFENTLIHNSVPRSSPIFFRDQDTDWPFEMQSFEVIAGEVAVT